MTFRASQSTRGGLPPRVLVVTHALDPTADFVLRELSERRVPFWRTDLADFLTRTTLRTELGADGRWTGSLHDSVRGIDLSELRAVWWRKPTLHELPGPMSGPERRFATGQAKRAITVLGSLPGVLWVNRPQEALDVGDGDGMNVLEFGAGTGSNAALLSHRLGDAHVTTVDIAEDITGPARERLAAAGYRPTVITADGSLGAPDRAPYDRIIVTCGLTTVPPALLRQLTADGFLLAPLGNALARIHPTAPGTATGRFLAHGAFFMPLRHTAGDGVPTRRPRLPTGPGRPSTLPASAIADNHFRFLAGIAVPGLTWQYDLSESGEITGARVWHPDGSIAQAHPDTTVTETGARKL